MADTRTIPKENVLVHIIKLDEGGIYPVDEHKRCSQHYDSREFSGYEELIRESSMPHVWCEICNPPDYKGLQH